MAIGKPDAGEDCRKLWRYVSQLVDGINSLMNMSVSIDAPYHGTGRLSILGGSSEIKILTAGLAGVLQKLDPQIFIGSSQDPCPLHQSVYWAVHLPVDATGTLSFYLDNRPFGTYTVSGGVVFSASISTLTQGDHDVLAVYSGDSVYNQARVDFTQRIAAKEIPPMSIISDSNPIQFGSDIGFDAQIQPTGTSPPAPTGLVTFYADGSEFDSGPISLLSPGVWHYHSSDLSRPGIGKHNIHADYAGDHNYAAATADLVQLVLVKPTVTLTLPTTGIQPNVPFWIIVTVTGGGTPGTGNVQLYVAGAAYGDPVPLVNGTARIEVTLPSGSFNFVAAYSGDNVYFSGSSPTSPVITVGAAGPSNYAFGGIANDIQGMTTTSTYGFTIETQDSTGAHLNYNGNQALYFYAMDVSAASSSGYAALVTIAGVTVASVAAAVGMGPTFVINVPFTNGWAYGPGMAVNVQISSAVVYGHLRVACKDAAGDWVVGVIVVDLFGAV